VYSKQQMYSYLARWLDGSTLLCYNDVALTIQHKFARLGEYEVRMMTAFGERIRELRTERDDHMSLRELAGRVGIDFTYLSKIENGKVSPPSNEVIEKLARELEADLEELLALAAKVSQEDLRKAVAQDPRIGVLFRKLQSRDLSEKQLKQMLEIAVSSEQDDATDSD
jgi:transcriptional regulator with XRE-family HTH domain